MFVLDSSYSPQVLRLSTHFFRKHAHNGMAGWIGGGGVVMAVHDKQFKKNSIHRDNRWWERSHGQVLL